MQTIELDDSELALLRETILARLNEVRRLRGMWEAVSSTGKDAGGSAGEKELQFLESLLRRL